MGNMRFKIRLFSIASLSFGSGMNIVALQFGLWFGWVPIAIGIVAFIYSTFPVQYLPGQIYNQGKPGKSNTAYLHIQTGEKPWYGFRRPKPFIDEVQ